MTKDETRRRDSQRVRRPRFLSCDGDRRPRALIFRLGIYYDTTNSPGVDERNQQSSIFLARIWTKLVPFSCCFFMPLVLLLSESLRVPGSRANADRPTDKARPSLRPSFFLSKLRAKRAIQSERDLGTVLLQRCFSSSFSFSDDEEDGLELDSRSPSFSTRIYIERGDLASFFFQRLRRRRGRSFVRALASSKRRRRGTQRPRSVGRRRS